MPRKSGDGRGRLGGRAPGTPNKKPSVRNLVQGHGFNYFAPSIVVDDKLLKGLQEVIPFVPFKKGDVVSWYEIDRAMLDPDARTDREIKLLNYYTAKMQSTSVDMTVVDDHRTIVERLALLATGKEIKSPESE